MKRKFISIITLIMLTGVAFSAEGAKEVIMADSVSSASTQDSQENYGPEEAAAELGITKEELQTALGDPNAGPPNIADAAAKLGIDEASLQAVFDKMTPGEEESAEVDRCSLVLNGIEIPTTYPTFSWSDLPDDVVCERNPVQSFTDEEGNAHYYESIFVKSGYLACPESDVENSFVFSLTDDDKYFWHFEEDGDHYGISIGPFLGGYQPEGSAEPTGGWIWLSGESQPIMGFGEMNIPVPTWGDYMEAVGAYGLTRSPGQSYGFIIEYESDPI